MTIIRNGLVLLRLVFVILSTFSFRKAFTPPITPPFPTGKRWTEPQWMTIFLIRYAFPVLKIVYELASLNECLYTLCTSFPDLPTPIPSRPTQPAQLYCPYPTPRSSSRLATTIWPLLALILVSIGQSIRDACYRAFNSTFTFDLRSDSAKSTPLVTHGPYSIVRHPAYGGSWLIVFGIVGFHLSPGSWIYERSPPQSDLYTLLVGVWIAVVFAHMTMLTVHTREEDELLKNHFGEKWERWRKIVKYKLVPGLY